jgi:hypothetical protein
LHSKFNTHSANKAKQTKMKKGISLRKGGGRGRGGKPTHGNSRHGHTCGSGGGRASGRRGRGGCGGRGRGRGSATVAAVVDVDDVVGGVAPTVVPAVAAIVDGGGDGDLGDCGGGGGHEQESNLNSDLDVGLAVPPGGSDNPKIAQSEDIEDLVDKDYGAQDSDSQELPCPTYDEVARLP